VQVNIASLLTYLLTTPQPQHPENH